MLDLVRDRAASAGVENGATAILSKLLALTDHSNSTVADAAARAIAHACAPPVSAAGLFVKLPHGMSRLYGLVLDEQAGARKRAVSAVQHIAAAACAANASAASLLAQHSAEVPSQAGPAVPSDAADALAGQIPVPIRSIAVFVEPLVQIVGSGDSRGTRLDAVLALGHLARCPWDGPSAERLDMRMMDAGALTKLRAAANSLEEDKTMQAACTSALRSLADCLTPASRRVYVREEIKEQDQDGRRARRLRPRPPSQLGVGAPRSPLALS